jgi:DNA-binding XRE family transcriptional regulator
MKNANITTFEEHLDKQYGERGASRREVFEQGYEAFKLGVLIEEARLKMNLTRQELADRAGISKAFITRIENDASDIKLSTLMRIVNKGLGGKVVFSLQV